MPVATESTEEVSNPRWESLLLTRSLTEVQRAQLRTQFEAHRHAKYQVDLDFGIHLPGFVVDSGVMRPENMSSRWLAEYLTRHADRLSEKTVLDMGCGTGIQGVVAALSGAKGVVFADLSSKAIANTRENVLRFGLTDGIEICESGDLFDCVRAPVDVIIFNHPFFAADPVEEVPVSRAMMDSGDLIHRFFRGARAFCRGLIIMPFFHLAGDTNDPGVQAPLHGYNVVRQHKFSVREGLQQGAFSIYEIAP